VYNTGAPNWEVYLHMHQNFVQGISVIALHMTFVFSKVIFWTNGVEFNVFNVFQSCTDFEVHSVQNLI